MNKSSTNIEKVFGNYVVKLNVSSDALIAHIQIKYQMNSDNILEEIIDVEKFPTVYELNEFLVENNIVFGVEEYVLEDIVRNRLLDSVIVANGRKPIAGIDAKIEYNYDFSKNIKLIQDDDGNIDFKNLNWFSQVKKNDVIAVKTPATKGIDGMSVRGDTIKAKEGKDITFRFGKNVSMSYDFMKLYSLIDGIVEMTNGKVYVNEVLFINGDVDISIGNIDFIGDLFVVGDVKAGYNINVGGSMQVNGVLEASDITVEKDLIVRGGIQGSDTTRILTKGSIICKFIENANVVSQKDISTEFIIHSNVNAGENIFLNGRRNMIVGGDIVSKGSILANTVGSSMGTKTSVSIGVDSERMDLLKVKRNRSDELNIRLKKLVPIIEKGKHMLQIGSMDKLRKEVFAKSLNEYNDIANELKCLSEDIEHILLEMTVCKESYLLVKKNIYPGVKVSIFGNTRYIKDYLNDCKIYLKGNEVAIEQR